MAFQFRRAMRAFYGLHPGLDSGNVEEDAAAAYALGLIPDAAGFYKRPRYSVPRHMVKRDRTGGWLRLQRDYFDHEKVYPDAFFRRRYRMRPSLFKRIADAVVRTNDFFKQKPDALARMGSHPYQKMLAAISVLATATPAAALDREYGVSSSLIYQSVKEFARTVVHIFGDTYLRAPNQQDIDILLQMAEARGFPGMIGSIDCMHWEWGKCPTSWHGEHVGHIHKPTLILEAVVGPNLWFWHAYFGLPGSLNDINVLHRSNVFDDLAAGNGPQVEFSVNGNVYRMGYYLADGIYPNWGTLIKGVQVPVNAKQKLFTQMQAAYRKDVERGFGVLQAKFAIVKHPAKYMNVEDLKYIMRCCIILQNMGVEDERGLPPAQIHDFENASPPVLVPKHSSPTVQQLIENHKRIESREEGGAPS